MYQWVKLVLAEYLRAHPPPPGVILALLLDDEYQCHVMALIVKKIQQLGIKIIHITSRCTGFCQPLDVGVD